MLNIYFIFVVAKLLKSDIFPSSTTSKLDELRLFYKNRFENYIEDIENKYYPKEGKLRHVVDASVGVTKKCFRAYKKCICFPIDLFKKIVQYIYCLFVVIIFMVKTLVIERKIPTLSYLKEKQESNIELAHLKNE